MDYGKENKKTEEVISVVKIQSDVIKNLKRDKNQLITIITILIIAMTILTLSIHLSWLWWTNQYDYSSTITSTGVYSLIDSDGNIISSDIPPDGIERILEILDDINNDER